MNISDINTGYYDYNFRPLSQFQIFIECKFPEKKLEAEQKRLDTTVTQLSDESVLAQCRDVSIETVPFKRPSINKPLSP